MAVTYGTFCGQTVYEERGGTERVYVPDTLGSTAVLVDTAGNVTDTFSYWPYGEERALTGTTATPFRYIGTLGYYRDGAGRLYVRARTLIANYARWLTVDPLWPVEGAFVYAQGRPHAVIDPSGKLTGFGGDCDKFPDCMSAYNCCILDSTDLQKYIAAACGIVAAGSFGACFSACVVGGVFTGGIACTACLAAAGISAACVIAALANYNNAKQDCRSALFNCLRKPAPPWKPAPPDPAGPSTTLCLFQCLRKGGSFDSCLQQCYNRYHPSKPPCRPGFPGDWPVL